MEIISPPRRFPIFSPFSRSVAALLAAGFAAYELGKGEVAPGMLLVVAAVVALVVAIQLVPHGPVFIRKPKNDPDKIALRAIQLELAAQKRTYSPPHLTQLESREFSEPAWQSSREFDSFQALRPFYVVYPKRNFTAIAASLKFHGDKDYRDWQPVANSAPQQSPAEHPEDRYHWTLIAYVPPKASFDAKLKLRDSQSNLGVAILRDLVAAEDRPFQSVHLKLPAPIEHFAASASD